MPKPKQAKPSVVKPADAAPPAPVESPPIDLAYRQLVHAVGVLLPDYHDLVRVVGHQRMEQLKALHAQLVEKK